MNLDTSEFDQTLFYIAVVFFTLSLLGFALTGIYFSWQILKRQLGGTVKQQQVGYGYGYYSWLIIVFGGIMLFSSTIIYQEPAVIRYSGLFFLFLGLVSGWHRRFRIRRELNLLEKTDDVSRRSLKRQTKEIVEKLEQRSAGIWSKSSSKRHDLNDRKITKLVGVLLLVFAGIGYGLFLKGYITYELWLKIALTTALGIVIFVIFLLLKWIGIIKPPSK